MSRKGTSVTWGPCQLPQHRVIAHPVLGQPRQRVVDGLHPQRGEVPVFLNGRRRIRHTVLGNHSGVIDLQDEPGLDDGAVLLLHGVGDGEQVLLLGGVILVSALQFDGSRRTRGDERFVGIHRRQRRLEVVDVLLHRRLALVGDGGRCRP